MKTARFLLACALTSLLAACGSQGITAPDASVPGRHLDTTPATGTPPDDTTYDTGNGSSNCVVVIVVNPDGSITTTCQVNANGQLGSGT